MIKNSIFPKVNCKNTDFSKLTLFDLKWPRVKLKVSIEVDIIRASKWLFMIHTCMSHPARHFRVKLKIWPQLTQNLTVGHKRFLRHSLICLGAKFEPYRLVPNLRFLVRKFLFFFRDFLWFLRRWFISWPYDANIIYYIKVDIIFQLLYRSSKQNLFTVERKSRISLHFCTGHRWIYVRIWKFQTISVPSTAFCDIFM